MRAPAATYRVQLSQSFRFVDVQRMAGYLDGLGISDIYCSPILAAREGSRHGYDISDHGRLNPELGDDGDLRTLSATLRARGMGLIVDFVPNHMGADPDANRWWRDVLENGPSSAYARFFDIDWRPAKPELHNKVLLPILGRPYGDVLARGELRLELADGAFVIRYFERRLPTDPKEMRPLLIEGRERLASDPGHLDEDVAEMDASIDLLGRTPPHTSTTPQASLDRADASRGLQQRLGGLLRRSEPVRRHFGDVVDACNGTPGETATFDRLHALLESQPYRLAYWRAALDEINYRRFFDVNDLAGLRVESPAVFAAAHALLLDLVEERVVTGLRIDHPDGLYDPEAYFHALRNAVSERLGNDSIYVVVEKILGRDETLRKAWEVDGTTGYNALASLNGLFVYQQGLADLRRTYRRLTRYQRSPADTTHDARRLVMRTALASELRVLTAALSRLAEADRHFRDFTFTALQRVLIEIVACFPVYRTYVTDAGASAEDAAVVDAAIADAKRRNPLQDQSIFEFVRQVLLPAPDASGDQAAADRIAFARKFQQYTAAVSAKGLEDTAFYNDVLLLSANEVGADLDRRTRTVSEFHDDNQRRLADWPLEMTAASTHDTKRGEDARARISVIAEMDTEWRQHVASWSAANRQARSDVAGSAAPDRNDEWLFYQSLVGAWPTEPVDAAIPSAADPELVGRMRAFMRKAVREAKRHTSWLYEHPAYERAVDQFVERVLAGPAARRFLSSFVPFARRLSWFGMLGSLSQVVLRIGGPGVPDFYQGAEVWNLALVDPDNRRAVNLPQLCHMLTSLEPQLARPDRSVLEHILDNWADGRVKLYTTAASLRTRRANKDAFLAGTYEPLACSDDVSSHVVAFTRHDGDRDIVVAAPRFVATLQHGHEHLPLGHETWGSATLRLPARLAGSRLVNVFTGESSRAVATDGFAALPLARVFNAWPVAMFVGYPL